MKALYNYYSSKFKLNKVIATSHRQIEDADSPLELKIQNWISEGNIAFESRKYQQALDFYLLAWNSLPTTIWPWFPQVTGNLVAEKLRLFRRKYA